MAVPASLLAHLLPHPETPCPEVDSVEVRIFADEGHLHFTYLITGRVEQLSIPPAAPACRVDGLWQYTCCEAFVGARGDPAYREFNFSPSGHWAAFDFLDTRHRVADPDVEPPSIEALHSAASLQVSVRVCARDLPVAGPCELGLSVVVESLDGRQSYWALHHPAPRPDFHHRASFTLALELAP